MTDPQPPRTPPRFVPVLTEVVDAAPAAVALAGPATDIPADDLAERVLQRVDAALARDLPDAVADLVQQQLQVLVPQLREQLANRVRLALADALAAELGANPPS